MVAKGEKVAKFMLDLCSDQETKQLLLTEADYNAGHVRKDDISTFQTPSQQEDRAQLLNERNAGFDWDSDTDVEETWENTCYQDSISGTTTSKVETNDMKKDTKTTVSWMEVCVMNLISSLNSQSSYVDRYYSIASVFKCEHFRSMRISMSNDSYEQCNSNMSLMCPSSYFCSVSAGIPSSYCSVTTANSTFSISSSADATSSCFQLDTSDSYKDCNTTDEYSSAITLDGCSVGGVNHSRAVGDFNEHKIDQSSSGGEFSDITITESDEVPAEDMANDKETNIAHQVKKHQTSSISLRKSQSMDEVPAGASSGRATPRLVKHSSTIEMMSHTLQLTYKIRSLRQNLLKGYKESFCSEQRRVIWADDSKESTEGVMTTQQKLISCQMLNLAKENTICKLKLQLKMKEKEMISQREKQVLEDIQWLHFGCAVFADCRESGKASPL